nr:DEAD/DEAH box helicase family protein [uncultured Campylobacter sp.]
MKFLYEILSEEFGKRGIEAVNLPKSVSENLKFMSREYQKEAFKRFILLYENDFNGKPQLPLHTMFNMATGSGKTLVMAGLMLYLFEKGYKNFIFFVNSDNIIKKTKENFLNANSNKYLFTERIFINSKEIFIKECENFEGIQNKNEINIKFCTIQKLHSDLNSPRENAVTFEDLADKNIVLIADEAHHLSADTRNNAEILEEPEKPSWENTVDKILKLNSKNLLLEFSATLDYESVEITEKYKDKVLFKYDLKAFREQGYSKEIELFKSDMCDENKMMSAVILNLYRSVLAAKYGINLKPVVLFKSKIIKESNENEEKFRRLVDEADVNFVDKFRNEIKDKTLAKAFKFFDANGISSDNLAQRIRQNFKPQNCLNVNNESEIKENQIVLNSLEDEQNPVRAIFAVNKLNEGWDVLNLFDIVRLYESRDGKNGKPGKTTISEAQLIGRGARYFPFKLNINSDDNKFKRKFDRDLDNELRILEEIYYHTSNDSRYISEIKTALRDIGIYDEDTVRKELRLKDSFKASSFYKNALVWHNDKILIGYDKAKFEEIPNEIDFTLGSNLVFKEAVFNGENLTAKSHKILKEKKIPRHILRVAMSADEYFYFENLQANFTDIKSTSEFLKLLEDKFSVNFISDTDERAVSSNEYLAAAKKLLRHIKDNFEIISKYKASEYRSKKFKEVFKDKSLNIAKDDERINGQENVISDKEWYVFNANYGTSEEKAFVEFFMSHFNEIKKKYKEIYLVRNEQELKIYNENGRAFEPDFLLFCKDESGEKINLQIFIEPKGDGYIANDKWKEEFLEKIFNDRITKNLSSKSFLITAISKFYNKKNENEFKKEFEDLILK